jgi:hypothetical protein
MNTYKITAKWYNGYGARLRPNPLIKNRVVTVEAETEQEAIKKAKETHFRRDEYESLHQGFIFFPKKIFKRIKM